MDDAKKGKELLQKACAQKREELAANVGANVGLAVAGNEKSLVLAAQLTTTLQHQRQDLDRVSAVTQDCLRLGTQDSGPDSGPDSGLRTQDLTQDLTQDSGPDSGLRTQDSGLRT